jgi:Tfp pilus assembly protein PilN
MNAVAASPLQVNLYNPELLPKRERFSARQIATGVLAAGIAMAAVAWWALMQSSALRKEMAEQAQYRAAQTARAMVPPTLDGKPVPTPQEVAALEQGLKAKRAQLESRRAARDTLKRGMASAESGPSALMRLVATSIPREAWLTELRAAGSRLDVAGRATDPAAVEAWLARLRTSGFLAEKPAPALKLERMEAGPAAGRGTSGYTFNVSATLAAPFADEGKAP